ncbi:sacsin N-terminal ATP-binding-like domain-containing protein [Nibricoccus sp. IMCC34717]|uniref:DUF3883 domain-containing protein n=1 Tax=Nibricoccus sp. IMCC34717 TaxID=3034021 RepID=UPI00384E489F
MPTDYEKLRSDNIVRYGTDIGRIGPMLLAQRYDNRSHFIFELLQNAEDALRRQVPPPRNREVSFRLEPDALVFSHFGAPFTPEDVRFICGIGESTETHSKRLTDIGRFGIGFKSVYAFTDRPEIHSGDEHFAIENYVHPCRIDPIHTESGQTVFRFPFNSQDSSAYAEIHTGLADLELSTLIFLREIERVSWQSGQSLGDYLREAPPAPGARDARKVTIVSASGADATYLVFERPVYKPEHPAIPVGRVEVAYHFLKDRVEPVESAKLSVFFPTIVHTQFGAILQGPFRTTPSRDNIPRDDAWNKHLVAELAQLVPDSIRQLKAIGKLDAQALHALPIQKERFISEPLFQPIFNAVRSAFVSDRLIPCHDGTHRPSAEVRLGRTAEIRTLFSPEQLGELDSSSTPLAWVIDGVTADRTPQLHKFLNLELGILDFDAAAVLSRLKSSFLESQTTEWLARFYEFLAAQEGAWQRSGLLARPIIRLTDGTHVSPFDGDEPRAYLSAVGTDYPAVHPVLCAYEPALKFLKRIGLTVPDVVDDVISHLLPRFADASYAPSDAEYAAAIERIHAAAETNLSDKRKRLLDALRVTPFVFATDAASGARSRVCPPDAYIYTDRLATLFAGISGVWLIDKDAGNIPNETHRKLLRACGGNEYLLPIQVPSRFTTADLYEMRKASGYQAINTRYDAPVTDFTLRDLEKVFAYLSVLPVSQRHERALLLWDALAEVETNRGKTFFSGEYSWFHYAKRSCSFPAAFVEQLRKSPWVPKPDGTLGLPSEVVFETITPPWPAHPFLLSIVPFKPRAEVELAQLAGLEPDLLDLLKSQGITSKKQLADLLKLSAPEQPAPAPEAPPTTPTAAIDALLGGDAPAPSEPVGGSTGEYAPGAGRQSGNGTGGNAGKTASSTGSHSGSSSGPGGGGSSGGPGGGGGHTGSSHPNPGSYRPAFHTYVATSPDDTPPDPEGLDQAARMQIEQVAIAYILTHEPDLQTTPPGNPGFDLFEGPSADPGQATRYVEVKSRSGSWSSPVALSREQFLKAQAEGDRYWLYVVENTRDPVATQLHRIQNPAGKSHHFTFDPGWSALAESAP